MGECKKNIENLAKDMGLNEKQIQGTFNRMSKNKPKATQLIDQSFLSKNMKEAYKNTLDKKYKQVNIP
jgi:serine/threonine-protein kinase HipA